MHELGIESNLLNAILAGQKTIEIRLGTPKILKIREGDKICLREDVWENDKIIESTPDRATITVTQLLYFETFKETLETVNFSEAIPGAPSPQAALKIYKNLYSDEDEYEYGAVAIMFELA